MFVRDMENLRAINRLDIISRNLDDLVGEKRLCESDDFGNMPFVGVSDNMDDSLFVHILKIPNSR